MFNLYFELESLISLPSAFFDGHWQFSPFLGLGTQPQAASWPLTKRPAPVLVIATLWDGVRPCGVYQGAISTLLVTVPSFFDSSALLAGFFLV
jgi:hypothetical protein